MTVTSRIDGWVPSACTLPSVERPLRVAEFDGFFGTAVHRVTRSGRHVLDVRIAAESEAVARELTARETQCCSFFRFDFTPDADGLVMRVEVPDEYVDVLDALEIRVRVSSGRRPDAT